MIFVLLYIAAVIGGKYIAIISDEFHFKSPKINTYAFILSIVLGIANYYFNTDKIKLTTILIGYLLGTIQKDFKTSQVLASHLGILISIIKFI